VTTQQRMAQALNQADQHCKDGQCVLSPAIHSVGKLLPMAIHCHALTCPDPEVGSFEYGLHVGYRLAQLEWEERSDREQEN
jgi:hypothetical protein